MPGNIVQIDPTVVETKAAIKDKEGKIVAPGEYTIAWTATYDDGSTTPLQMVLPDLHKRLNNTYGADKDGNLVRKGTTTKVTVDDIDAAIVAYMASGAKAPKKTYDEALAEAITQSDNTGVPWIVTGNSTDGYKAQQAGNPANGYEWARATNGAWMQVKKQSSQVDTFPSEEAAQREADARSERLGKAYKVVRTKDGTAYTLEEVPTKETTGQEWTTPQAVVEALTAAGLDPAKYDVYPTGQGTFGYKAKGAQPTSAPPTITWKDGYGWYQSEVDGQWIRIDPKSLKSQFEDSIYKDFTEGREADALRKWDFLNQPTSMELAQFALEAAQSPADYFTIWAIARGEMPVQAQGPFGRIAPNAQWLDAALARLFQWTAGSGLTPDDVFKGANGQAGPQGNAATQTWDEIQAQEPDLGKPWPGGPSAPVPFGGYPSDVAFPAEEGGGMSYSPQPPSGQVQLGPPGGPQLTIGATGPIDWDAVNATNAAQSNALNKDFVPYHPSPDSYATALSNATTRDALIAAFRDVQSLYTNGQISWEQYSQYDALYERRWIDMSGGVADGTGATPPTVPFSGVPAVEEEYQYGQAAENEAKRTGATPPTVPFGGYPSDVAFPAEEGGGMTYTPQQPTPFTPIVRTGTGGRSMEGGELYTDEEQDAGEGAPPPPPEPIRRTVASGIEYILNPETNVWEINSEIRPTGYEESAGGGEPTGAGYGAGEPPTPSGATVPFGGYPSGVAFPADEGGGMTYTPPTPSTEPITQRVASGIEYMLNPKTNLWEINTKARPLATGGLVTSPTVALLGERGPEAVIPFGRDVSRWPTWMKRAYAGRSVPPVQRQYPAMGGPPFPSSESWRNFLPSERGAFQQAVKMQGIPFEDYLEQWRRTTQPTGRNYRRSRFGQTVPFGVGRG